MKTKYVLTEYGRNLIKKQGRKLLSFTVAVLMIVSALPFSMIAADDLLCEHEHTAECYGVPEDHVCSIDAGCEPVYAMMTVETGAHTHGDGCYDIVEVTPGHVHEESCYDRLGEEFGDLICTTEPGDGAIYDSVLICGLTEGAEQTTEVPDYDAGPIDWICGAEKILVCDHANCTYGQECLSDDGEGLMAMSRSSGFMGIMPMSAGLGLAEIGIRGETVDWNRQQTWYDLVNNTSPGELFFYLDFEISEDIDDGGVVRIPLDFTPTLSSHPYFTYGTDGAGNLDPFYSLDTTKLDAILLLDSNVLFLEYEITGDVLVLKMKDLTLNEGTIFYTLPLTLTFNQDWNAKIPGDTVLWTVAPELYIPDGGSGEDLAGAATPVDVVGAARTNYPQTVHTRQSPANPTYTGGVLGIRIVTNNNSYYQADFDEYETNTAWLEIPHVATIQDASTASYYNNVIPNYWEDDVNGIWYDRYSHTLSPGISNTSDYNYIHYQGRFDQTFNQLGVLLNMTGASLNDGDVFYIRSGVTFTECNSEERDTLTSSSYTKTAKPAWSFFLTATHTTGSSTSISVVGLADGTRSRTNIRAGYDIYSHQSSSKNTGAGPINGVSLRLYQFENTAQVPKVNFDEATLVAMRAGSEAGYIPPWSAYRVEYDIWKWDGSAYVHDRYEDDPINSATSQGDKDIVGGYDVWFPLDSASAVSRDLALTLPVLAAGEYIYTITAIPMGIDGDEDGVLPSENGMCLRYVAKAWNGQVWPNGDPMAATT